MKKKVFGRQLSRERDSRLALFRSLTRALILHGKIETTKAKAKAVKPFIEKLLRIAKKGEVKSRRKVYGLLGNDRETTDALMKLAGKLKGVGGYTRMVNLPTRRGDAAELVRFEWAEDLGMKEEKASDKSKNKRDKNKKKSKGKS